MDSQDAAADGMKGTKPRHAFHRLAEHVAEPQLHLARRLVGEGDREDFAGSRATLAQDVGDARGQDARLAGAGPGQHQHRALQRLHRLALLRIEACEVLRACRGACARGNTASRRLVVGNGGMQSVRLGHANRLPPRWHRGAVKGSLDSRIGSYIGASIAD